MASNRSYLAILSLLLFNGVKSQTGEGCFMKTCDHPGQVRINAIVSGAGTFLGGCNCACPPETADPASPSYCEPPKVVNYDVTTMMGDCSCNCPPEIMANCLPPYAYDPVTCGCHMQCQGNQVLDPSGHSCSCPTAINGAFLPSCTPPQVQDPVSCDCTLPSQVQPSPPMMTQPAVPYDPSVVVNAGSPYNPSVPAPPIVPGQPIAPAPYNPPVATAPAPLNPGNPAVVNCQDVGNCECPPGTAGTCTINCDVNTDACKDGIIKCNNDGFGCNVNCIGGSACAGAAQIIGPVGGSLNVNCIGGQSCEGSVSINGEFSIGMSVDCQGGQACKGSVEMLFGTGHNTLKCGGAPDSCQGTNAVVPPNAMSYQCLGAFCPAQSANAHTVMCEMPGNCGCPIGTQQDCLIICEGGNDACKDGLIECNNDGFDCTVNCLDPSGCAGSAQITGPVGGNLAVNCIGEQSCEGAVRIDGSLSNDVNIDCQGMQSCKGSLNLLFGSGRNALQCSGDPDACSGLYGYNFVIPPTAMSFECLGPFCPVDAPANFNKVPGQNPGAPAPGVPALPVIPGYPAVPQVPQAPQVPQPQYPQYPVAPQAPQVPQVPQASQVPQPQYPAQPQVPQPQPQYPQYPQYPATPQVPQTPQTSAVPPIGSLPQWLAGQPVAPIP